MKTPSPHTTQLHLWLQRIKAGDLAARDELLRSVGEQLERLARKMLRRFAGVRRWADTDDVMQNAVLRLLRALEQVHPESMRHFFGLAGQQMRRELIDLSRHYYGPHGHGANYASAVLRDDSLAPAPESAATDDDHVELERWTRFHEEVERLSTQDREIVSLIFYHQWKQAEVAELLDVTVRTVQRRWQACMVKLHGLIAKE